MSRQLDLQLYLALNGYSLKEIPEERFDDYMREPHYSTDADAMLELDREMRERKYLLWLQAYSTGGFVALYKKPDMGRSYSKDIYADTEPLARALAAYKALTGKEWEDGSHDNRTI